MAQRKTKKQKPAAARRPPAGRRAARMPFERRNYVLLLGALGLIVGGYVLMLVDNATSDNPVDSPLSLTVAALLLLVGYVGVIYAILAGLGGRDDTVEVAEPTPEVAEA